MPIIEHYKSNRNMRETYIRMNSLTHVEAWDTDEGYVPALCSAEGIGFPENDREFRTVGQVMKWAQEYCPELPFHS